VIDPVTHATPAGRGDRDSFVMGLIFVRRASIVRVITLWRPMNIDVRRRRGARAERGAERRTRAHRRRRAVSCSSIDERDVLFRRRETNGARRAFRDHVGLRTGTTVGGGLIK